MKWEREHPDHHIYVWGMDATEKNRAARLERTLTDYEHEFPLIEHNLTKEEAHGIADKLGLKRPIMYDMGYRNNLDELDPTRGNINDEVMEDCTIACQLLTWNK